MRDSPGFLRDLQAHAVRASRMVWSVVREPSVTVSAAAGLFLALSGAFTGYAPLSQRLAFWLPTMLIGGVVGSVIGHLLASRRPNQTRFQLWALVTVGVTGPLTLIVWAMSGWVFGATGPGRLLAILPSVALVSAAMTAIFLLLRPPVVVTQQATSEGGGAKPSRFQARLPAKLSGAEIYAVEAEDHYLRVRTSKGADLVLFRLTDAVAELEGIEGAQVHRSWWVARAGVAEVRRGGGKVSLLLKDGAEAPVSRANVRPLRDAGWI